ncbi:radical SAM family heme chaperone HemW [Schaalia sp. ZJ1691]|uniref:radical SAM family heme chaperone HemW n=1 Tax=Schaalia sp. ZJ1691 TaxID=2709404 RepID=UPI0013EE1250|nr:radical SAM family heme chaperone HemW [Schaalia sp. ZJ1691]
MSPHQPDGITWPTDGRIDPACAEVEQSRPLSVYVHVPFCRVRCGYCDFNTYTAQFGQGADLTSYHESVVSEVRMAASILNDAGFARRPARTVFFGGGTPTLLDTRSIAAILHGIRSHIGLADDCEITVEANPETVDAQRLKALKDAGVTRVSFGMQSAVPSVLRTLDRTHTPERVPVVVAAAREVGLDTSLDLIYGTPGETVDQWRLSVEAAIGMRPDHISAYALVIEEGTKMAAQVARGDLPLPDPDDEATKYELADELLGAAGYRWYEISNFARVEGDEDECASTSLRHASRHNLAYWRDWDWWGFGPGAHSHIGRLRWWNVKHPRAYAGRLAGGMSPGAAGEILGSTERELERVMLSVRTADGATLSEHQRPDRVARLIADGLVDPVSALRGQIVLTLRGRLLADLVTRTLMGYDG